MLASFPLICCYRFSWLAVVVVLWHLDFVAVVVVGMIAS